ncbi:sensor domain-containing protein [Kitasatospora sp. NBC_01287]|uniref:sensor domain-containing protein n=1 Tax=Kitasatospora sp. NBC_01287 TaxID=2903573 RepID=UPI002254950D|nr:sensor domain-containing protein [Kitasatospora sp. NBC_01287]MCX4748155.1 sensor domain-containing protein [Kitasatospora sp. NBC_01287]
MSTLRAVRLRTSANPFRMLFSAAPWQAAAYLACYLVTGPALFAVAVVTVVAGAVLGQFTVALPLLAGLPWILRGCAQVERGRAALIAEPIPYEYRAVTEPGLTARIRTRCTDPATVRDCAYLVLLFPPLLALDVLALALWVAPLAGTVLPLLAWADGAAGHSVVLRIWGDDLPSALLMAAGCLALAAVLGSRLVVAAARLHLTVAHAVLRPPTDPLAEAKRMLSEPGPLHF